MGWSIGAAPAAQPATVAIVAPMSGISFSVGVQFKHGVTAALDALTDGTLLGRTLVVSPFDDQCDVQLAGDVARSLAGEPKPAVVIGHSCSGAAIAAAPIYAESGILQIAPASTASRLTELDVSTLFRMIGRDSRQAEAAATRMVERYEGRRIGLMHFPGAYSRELAAEVLAQLGRRGIVPAEVIVAEDRANSYAEAIEAFSRARIGVLYLVGGGLDSGIFVRQARLLDAPFVVLGSDTLSSRVFLDAAGSAAEDVLFTFPADVSRHADNPAARQALGDDPDGYTLLAYAAAEVWIQGVRRARTFDADKVAAALREAPLETALGSVSFDAKGDIVTAYEPFSWYRWRGGQRVRVD